jgi:hypothetical protein
LTSSAFVSADVPFVNRPGETALGSKTYTFAPGHVEITFAVVVAV